MPKANHPQYSRPAIVHELKALGLSIEQDGAINLSWHYDTNQCDFGAGLVGLNFGVVDVLDGRVKLEGTPKVGRRHRAGGPPRQEIIKKPLR